jgi:hypothetical protein
METDKPKISDGIFIAFVGALVMAALIVAGRSSSISSPTARASMTAEG